MIMFENIKLPLPLSRRKPFLKNGNHVTTTDYLRYKVVLSREVMPNEKVSVDARMFCRLTPMLKPAFARATFQHRAFFVPYRTIMSDWNALISDSKNKSGVVPSTTGTIDQRAFLSIFFNNQSLLNYRWIEKLTGASLAQVKLGAYDVALPSVDPISYGYTGTMNFYNLTSRGRFALDLFQSLGYEFPYRIPHDLNGVFSNWSGSGSASVSADYTLNALHASGSTYAFDSSRVSTLPIAAALKVYRDWYLKGTITPVKDGYYIDELIETISSRAFYGGSEDAVILQAAIDFMYELYYDNDYFTSASPTYMDTYGTASSIVIPDVSQPGAPYSTSAVQSGNTAQTTTPHLTKDDGSNAQVSGLSMYILQGLSALTKWMRRNNIVGNKTLDRYLAHYGIKLESEKLNRSVYLGKFETEIDVQAVMSNAQYYDSDNSEVGGLGDYAGAGIGASKGQFSYDSDEFGQLIMISVCKPEVCYYQGTKRELFHTERFKFFSGEFDNLGYQAVSNEELVASFPSVRMGAISVGTSNMNPQYVFPVNPTGVHGFHPRYLEYKDGRGLHDYMTGNFRVHRSGEDSYNYFQQFRSIFRVASTLNNAWVNEINFQSVADKNQFDRIFSNTDDSFDHFICHWRFNVTSWQPTMSPYDSLDFSEEEHQGKPSAVVNVGGTKF